MQLDEPSSAAPAVLMEVARNEYDFRPQSLWECYQLMSTPLPRDHSLVKGLDRRNQVKYSDIITGVSTESPSESLTRRSVAVEYVPGFIHELNRRNIPILGEGLVRQLLSLETDGDEDGIPTEADESRVTELIGRIVYEIQLKTTDKKLVENMLSSILSNREILFYTKYRLIKSVDHSVRCLSDQTISTSLTSHSSTALAAYSPRELLVKVEHFRHSISTLFSSQISRVLNSETEMRFIGSIFVIELIDSLMKNFTEVSQLEPVVVELGKFILRTDQVESDLCKLYLQLLLTDPRVLPELVEDEDIVCLIRRVLRNMVDTKKLDHETVEIANSIRECIDPYF
jgi:hypothetical protein